MRIAVTSTISWPYIRRGNRCSYELAVYLAEQGHDVTYITLKPGEIPRQEYKDGLRIEYHTIKEKPLLSLISNHKFESFTPACVKSLLRGDYDLIQTTFPIDAYAASIVNKLQGTPFVHMIYDCNPFHHPTKFGRHMFKTVVKKAGQLVVISDFVNDRLEEDYGIRGESIPLPVDTEQFTPCTSKDLSRPRILFTASLLEKRKRGGLLILAFEKLLEYRPEAILQLSGHINDFVSKMIFSMVNEKTRQAIRLERIGGLQDLPSLYQQAAISVLPSLNEAFGLVINESLACGTPVVGTRSGAIPDIIDDPAIGVLFEETDGPAEVCQALLKALELTENPETWRRCRAHVEKRYTWKTIGPQYETIYDRLVANRSSSSKKTAKKTKGPFKPIKPLSNTLPTDTKGLREIFIDALDAQQITYDAYFEIDKHHPRSIATASWLIGEKNISDGKILIISSDSRPFTLLFDYLGYQVHGVSVSIKVEPWKDMENPVMLPDLDATIEALAAEFDLIVFDGLLGSLAYPVDTLRRLRNNLKTNGHLLVMTENGAFISNRLKLITGKNIYPALDGGCITTLRQYSADELEGFLNAIQLSEISREHLIGTKPVHEVYTWFNLPLKLFLRRKSLSLLQRSCDSFKSHFFLTGCRKSTNG